jgi:hypothetical protein
MPRAICNLAAREKGGIVVNIGLSKPIPRIAWIGTATNPIIGNNRIPDEIITGGSL